MKLKDLIPEDISKQLENLSKSSLKKEAMGPEGPSAGDEYDAMIKKAGDVRAYDNFTDTNKQNQQYAKRIDIAMEFPAAFAAWFEDLGYEPGKITKSYIMNQVRDYLEFKGYK
jgi:hypothetical protein|tara:strand:- start:1082 stop:1420 length:339 start_codon:yes stop_codon:yes gene_type:complete